MSLPAGYLDFAKERGINGFHPDTWAPSDHVAFRAWKRAWLVAKWKMFRDHGMHRIMPREVLRSRVREDLDRVLAPAPSRPFSTCPCHRFAPVSAKPDTSPHGLDYILSFRAKVTA